MVLERLGIDPSLLPVQQIEKPRVLILDADGEAYRAAATARTLPTALRRFCTGVLEWQFLTNSNEVRLHLTAEGGYKGGRSLYPSFRPYQGNRTGKSKPALLEPLRALLSSPKAVDMGMPEDWFCKVHSYWEADDACTMDSYYYKDDGLVVSPDKDLSMTLHPKWIHQLGASSTLSNDWGWIEKHPDYTNPLGHGLVYAMYQWLAGDTADNIRGLDKLDGRNVGTVRALEFLQGKSCIDSVVNEILWNYAKIQQDGLAELQLLWMRRWEGDCAYKFLMECDLEAPLKTWVETLHKYHTEIFTNAQIPTE